MTDTEASLQLQQIDNIDNFDIPHKSGQYSVEWAKGAEANPQLAFRAQQIHGISYVAQGYFDTDALTIDGRLAPELDGTREAEDTAFTVNYLVARKEGQSLEEADASLRIIDTLDGESFENLPAYKYYNREFAAPIHAKLQNLTELYGQGSVRELAALGSVDNHSGSYELMRAIMQNALIKEAQGDHREVYISALTKKSLRPVVEFAGHRAVEVLSEPVRIFEDEPRAAKDLAVTAVLIDPAKVLDGIIDDIEASTGSEEVVRLAQKLYFLCDGLTEEHMSRRVTRFLRKTRLTY